MSEVKQYAERDAMALDDAGGYYFRHVLAMTGEKLHSKGDIAAELGWRDMQIEQLKAERDALAAENLALKSERAQVVEIGELIRTQDNRITDQPFFAVMTKREIVGSEDHDYDRICWVENQSGDYVEATETQHRRLEAIYQGKYEVREGWDRYAMKEIDVFVTGCFTEKGCKDYIRRNSHNLNKPFIYAFGSYRNNEYQAVRKFIMDMPETPATDAYLKSVRAEGVELVKAHPAITLCNLTHVCEEIANQLRAGKDKS